jgi:general secretion pathway protein D
MTASSRAACWLLVVGLAAGCASAAPPPGAPRAGGAADEPGRPRVEVTTEPPTSPRAPVLPPPVVPPPSPTETEPDKAATARRPPESGVPPSAAPPAAAAEAPPPEAAHPRARQLVLNFDNADVEIVIQAAAEIVGFNYVLSPTARGRKITVQTVGKISSDEVFAVLLTILDVNGLAAVRSGNMYRIIPREGAPQTPVKTVVGREMGPGLLPDEVVTQVAPLQFINAQDAAALLRPFVPAQGVIAAHRETNLLILTDTAANVRRLLDVLKLVDVEVALSELQIITLKHADAQELAQLLAQLFAKRRLSAGLGGSSATTALPTPSPAPGTPPGPPRSSAGELLPGGEAPLIVPERRSNSIVVHARKQDMETIRRLIDKLDVDIYGGQRVFIYFAENTRAKDLATTLDAIYGRGNRGPSITGVQQPLRASDAGISNSYLTAPSYAPYGGPTPLNPTASLAPSLPGASAAGSRPPGTSLPGLTGEGGLGMAEIGFIADEVTNSVIVPTYPRLWKEIEETIKKLDRMARQVLIEVLAAEVTLTDDTTLGVQWAVRSGKFDASSTATGTLPGRPLSGLLPAGGLVPPGLFAFAFATDKFLAALNALASLNKVTVLSSPTIMTAENRKAVINVSTSVPIVTSQQVPVATGGITGNSITQSVEYKDAGIILTVIPRIGEKGTVALDVKQEVNDVGPTQPPPINSPIFFKREAETSVVLLNNQTLVLGGLIQNRRTLVRTGIPWLNEIPILGYLFGSREWKTDRTELLLLITPRVVGTALDAARLTDEMRRVTPELEETMRQAPRARPSP